jgi:hypothetical protein
VAPRVVLATDRGKRIPGRSARTARSTSQLSTPARSSPLPSSVGYTTATRGYSFWEGQVRARGQAFGVIGPSRSLMKTCADCPCSRCSRRRARISSPCSGFRTTDVQAACRKLDLMPLQVTRFRSPQAVPVAEWESRPNDPRDGGRRIQGGGAGQRLGRPRIAPELEERIRKALTTPGRPGVRKIAERFGVDPGTRAQRAHWQHAGWLLLNEVRPEALTRQVQVALFMDGKLDDSAFRPLSNARRMRRHAVAS